MLTRAAGLPAIKTLDDFDFGVATAHYDPRPWTPTQRPAQMMAKGLDFDVFGYFYAALLREVRKAYSCLALADEGSLMADTRKLTPIGSLARCKQYGCVTEFYIETGHPSGQWHLVVRYGEGYGGPDDLPIIDGQREFAAAIPADWTDDDLHSLMLEPMNPEALWPAWELPARVHGTATLFRWWAGEKPR
jgi:hypothetical protein